MTETSTNSRISLNIANAAKRAHEARVANPSPATGLTPEWIHGHDSSSSSGLGERTISPSELSTPAPPSFHAGSPGIVDHSSPLYGLSPSATLGQVSDRSLHAFPNQHLPVANTPDTLACGTDYINGMGLDNFGTNYSDTPCRYRPSQGYNPMYSNAEVEELDDEIKTMLESLIRLWIKKGVEPWRHPKITADIAAAHGVDEDQISLYYVQRRLEPAAVQLPVASTSCHSSGQVVICFAKQSGAKQRLGDRVIQALVHKKEGDWRRHIELRRPQHVYLCCLCLSADVSQDKVFIHYRRDKIRTHLVDSHEAGLDYEAVIEASYKAEADPRGGSCDLPNMSLASRVCGYEFRTWDGYFKHRADHYKHGHTANVRPSTETASGLRSGADVLLSQTGRSTTTITRRAASQQRSRSSKRPRVDM
ncbi:hypothetical protein B0A48_00495 [Cryoendolithus antarcticus]|uniref:Uncharacterized protein n=1 Tax=Cryoendolithus antarcticus TaxID=1507870 RepID=A0A1V8TUW7_9PEZI|nr:hypothetical protein B0A48_00495 [Cryoendolithus antarcticus]